LVVIRLSSGWRNQNVSVTYLFRRCGAPVKA
jgi:hypothetical protein